MTNALKMVNKATARVASAATFDFLHGAVTECVLASKEAMNAIYVNFREVGTAYKEAGKWDQWWDTVQHLHYQAEDFYRSSLEFSGSMGWPSDSIKPLPTSYGKNQGSVVPNSQYSLSPNKWKEAGVYIFQEPDTLEAILKMFGQSKEAVPAFLEFNNWVDVYHDSQGKPVGTGTVVYIPKQWVEGAPQMLKKLKQAPELFFTDLYLDPATGDLATFGTDKTDIRTVRGTANVEQAIRNRLLTTQGESAAFPGYGLPFKPGDPVTSEISATYVASHLCHQLRRDVRIDDVNQIVVTIDGDSVHASMAITPTAGAEIPVISPIATGT